MSDTAKADVKETPVTPAPTVPDLSADLKKAQDELAAAGKKVLDLEAQVRAGEAKAAASEAEAKTLKDANTSLLNANKDVLEKLTRAEAELKASKETNAVLEKKVLQSTRSGVLADRLKISAEEAGVLAKGTLALDETSFNDHVETLAKTFEKAKEFVKAAAAEKVVEKAADKVVETPAEKKADSTTQATAADLKNVKSDDKPALAVADAGVDEVRKQVAAFMS